MIYQVYLPFDKNKLYVEFYEIPHGIHLVEVY